MQRKKLRECAEQRGGRLARDVTKLASDTSAQQATISQLSRRLSKVKNTLQQRDQQIKRASSQTQVMRTKLQAAISSAEAAPEEALDEMEGEDVAGTASKHNGRSLPPRKKGTASTGKLPQLSF